MNVLHINTYDVGGGAEQVALDLCSNQTNSILLVKKSSRNKNIISFPNWLPDKIFTFIDKIIWKFGIRQSIKELFFIKDQFNSTINKLHKIDAYKNADIIHLHNIHGNYFDLTALIAIAKEKPIVWTLHDMWAMTGGESHTLENENYKKGIGWTPYFNVPPLNKPIIDRRQHFIEYKKNIYKKIGDCITFVPVSYWLEDCLKSSSVFHSEMKYETIYNGVNIDLFKNLNNRIWEIPRIGFYYTDNPLKSSQTFIKQLINIKTRFELHVFGKPLLIEVPDHIKITNYSFFSEREKLCQFYNSIDILVSTSLAETFGLILCEAMSSGVCVVSSNVGAVKEIISNPSVGELFDNNTNELSVILEDLLNNLYKAREIGRNSSEHINENFSLKKCILNYEKLYKKTKS